MKRSFPHFADRSPDSYKQAWSDGLVVLDANVLLNLYRYREGTRTELLDVLSKLGERVWLPHYAALEFYRNRLGVMADEASKRSGVVSAVGEMQDKLRGQFEKLGVASKHSIIDGEGFLGALNQVVETFIGRVNEDGKSQQKLTDPDPIREVIEAVFDGRVGEAATSQAALDNIYVEAKARFDARVPPGFEDAKKATEKAPVFLHNGLYYKRQFGDFLIWVQMLEHAKKRSNTSLIFVTDDSKEDWWERYSLAGPQTIGPRVELREEAHSRGGVSEFLMYTPERFLEFASKELSVDVSPETLEEVRAVSLFAPESASLDKMALSSRTITRAVREWIRFRYPNVRRSAGSNLQYLAGETGGLTGILVRVYGPHEVSPPSVKRHLVRAVQMLASPHVARLALILVAEDWATLAGLRSIFESQLSAMVPADVSVTIGIVETDMVSRPRFIPHGTFDGDLRSATSNTPDLEFE